MPLSEELPRERGCPKEENEASAGNGLKPPLEAVGEDWDRESNLRGLWSGPVPTGTDELLSKALAVRDAGTRYPKGKGVFEVEGGGELAGYGSSEILVTFAPLSVGEFRSVQVGSDDHVHSPFENDRSTGGGLGDSGVGEEGLGGWWATVQSAPTINRCAGEVNDSIFYFIL